MPCKRCSRPCPRPLRSAQKKWTIFPLFSSLAPNGTKPSWDSCPRAKYWVIWTAQVYFILSHRANIRSNAFGPQTREYRWSSPVFVDTWLSSPIDHLTLCCIHVAQGWVFTAAIVKESEVLKNSGFGPHDYGTRNHPDFMPMWVRVSPPAPNGFKRLVVQPRPSFCGESYLLHR